MSQCSINPRDTGIEREYRRLKDASLSELWRLIPWWSIGTCNGACKRLDSFYRRNATNSHMRKVAANSSAAPIQSSAILGEACANLIVSSRVERYVSWGEGPRFSLGPLL